MTNNRTQIDDSGIIFEAQDGRITSQYRSNNSKDDNYLSGRSVAAIALAGALVIGTLAALGVRSYSRENISAIEKSISDVKAGRQQGITNLNLESDIAQQIEGLRSPGPSEPMYIMTRGEYEGLKAHLKSAINTAPTNKNLSAKPIYK